MIVEKKLQGGSGFLIKSIRLKNFRSYKDATVEFSPGVNIIAGENDSGKTNLLRAINLVVNNRPSGDEYRSNWGDDTEVLLEADDKIVGRQRTNSKNLYTLTGEPEPFKAFGTGVPDIIKRHLNITPVNIAFQLDGPFLLDKSPADVARYFNNIVNLDIIDSTISNIAATLRNERTALKAEQEREGKLEEKLKAYDWLPEAEKELVGLECEQQKIDALKADWTLLHSLTSSLEGLVISNQSLNCITEHDALAENLLQQTRNIELSGADLSELKSLIANFKVLTGTSKNLGEIVKYEKEVESLILQDQDILARKTDLSELAMMTTNLGKAIKERSRLQKITLHEKQTVDLISLGNEIIEGEKQYNSSYDLLEQYDELTKQVADVNGKLTELEKEFEMSMPDTCPLCGQRKSNHG